MNKVVLFDVDNVLVDGQTQKMLVSFLFRKGKISFFLLFKIYLWFILYKANLIKDVMKVRHKSYSVFTDWDVEEVKDLFAEFFLEVIKPKIFSKSIEIIEGHKKEGYEVILASASISEIVDALRDYLGLNYSISTKLEKVDGKYTGKIDGLITYGINKVKVVEGIIKNQGLSLSESYAYSDHHSDLPILELTENPIAVNPEKKLKLIAEQRQWRIYEFS